MVRGALLNPLPTGFDRRPQRPRHVRPIGEAAFGGNAVKLGSGVPRE